MIVKEQLDNICEWQDTLTVPLILLLTHVSAAHPVHEALGRPVTCDAGIGARIGAQMGFPRPQGWRNRCRYTDCRLESVRESIAAASCS